MIQLRINDSDYSEVCGLVSGESNHLRPILLMHVFTELYFHMYVTFIYVSTHRYIIYIYGHTHIYIYICRHYIFLFDVYFIYLLQYLFVDIFIISINIYIYLFIKGSLVEKLPIYERHRIVK